MQAYDAFRHGVLPALVLVLAACSRSEPAGGTAANGTIDPAGDTVATAVVAVEEAEADAEEATRPVRPARIYYDLTAFEWYRQGRPLVVDGRGFMPADRPMPLPETRLEKAGEYQDVDYYVDADAEPPFAVVYVPVFEDFWLPFAPTDVPAGVGS